MEEHELERLAELNGILAKSNDPKLRAELKLLLPKLLHLFFKAVVTPGDPPAWEDRTLNFMADMWSETDRGCVLVAVSHLDMLLTNLLEASLIERSKVPRGTA